MMAMDMRYRLDCLLYTIFSVECRCVSDDAKRAGGGRSPNPLLGNESSRCGAGLQAEHTEAQACIPATRSVAGSHASAFKARS